MVFTLEPLSCSPLPQLQDWHGCGFEVSGHPRFRAEVCVSPAWAMGDQGWGWGQEQAEGLGMAAGAGTSLRLHGLQALFVVQLLGHH